MLGKAIRRAPCREAVRWCPEQADRAVKSTPTLGRSCIQGAQLGWQSHRHTEVLQDLGIKAHRPQEGDFGAQTTNIAANHPMEPWYKGIDDLSSGNTDLGGPTKP
jgi:hypothetical protein